MIHLITYLFPLAVWLALVVFYVRRVTTRVRTQALLAGVLLLSLSKFALFAAFGTNAFAPELPEKVIWLFNFLYSGAIILLPFAILLRLCRVRGIALLLLIPIAWGMSARGIFNGIKAPEVHELTLTYPNLPPALDGYRIVQISDLHVSAAARRARTEAVVKRVNALNADLICLTGDLADGLAALQAPSLEPLRFLQAKDGVWAVAGNHEYYFDRPNYETLYARMGLRFLDNECVFPRPELALAGVTDSAAERWGEAMPSAEKALMDVAKDKFKLLLEHRPSHALDHALALGIDLQLSGHTHGGIMPGLDRLVAAANGGFVRGLYSLTELTQYLYVSPGTGQWAGFPIRFFNDSEITLITLRVGTQRGSICKDIDQGCTPNSAEK